MPRCVTETNGKGGDVALRTGFKVDSMNFKASSTMQPNSIAASTPLLRHKEMLSASVDSSGIQRPMQSARQGDRDNDPWFRRVERYSNDDKEKISEEDIERKTRS